MGKTNLEIIQACDASIKQMEEQQGKIVEQGKIADDIRKMEATPEYQNVIAKVFIEDESKLIYEHLTSGSIQLDDDTVKGLNDALAVIRGFKRFIQVSKEQGENVQERIALLDDRIAEEQTYRSDIRKRGDLL
jgi:hypothetical protein